jgi:hypothetical protein
MLQAQFDCYDIIYCVCIAHQISEKIFHFHPSHLVELSFYFFQLNSPKKIYKKKPKIILRFGNFLSSPRFSDFLAALIILNAHERRGKKEIESERNYNDIENGRFFYDYFKVRSKGEKREMKKRINVEFVGRPDDE